MVDFVNRKDTIVFKGNQELIRVILDRFQNTLTKLAQEMKPTSQQGIPLLEIIVASINMLEFLLDDIPEGEEKEFIKQCIVDTIGVKLLGDKYVP